MRPKRFVASLSPILLVAALSVAVAQDTAPEPQAEDETPPPAAPAADAPQPQDETPGDEQPKKKNGLYVEAGYGAYTPSDVDTSIVTNSVARRRAISTVSFDDQQYARAAIGWRLNGGKGDFRLIFNGWNEDGYTVRSQGFLKAVDPDLPVSVEQVKSPLLWWNLEIRDGMLNSVRTPPQWQAECNGATTGCDLNDDGIVDPGEQEYTVVDQNVMISALTSLENRAQTYDFVFGNVWGPKRFQGRWFGGFRYFRYDGNYVAPVWLAAYSDGQGFSDGAFLAPLNFSQETTGFGPTGLMEARFNFFNQVLQLYINGQVTFMVEELNVESGEFITLVQSSGGANSTVRSSLSESQSKSTWHTGAEAGIRIRLKNGLKFEMSYGVVGFLDAILLPNTIRVPEDVPEAGQGTSAIYNTQDYVLKGWRAGVAFQF